MRDYARHRLLSEMLKTCRQRARFAKGFIIMVLDDQTTPILSAYAQTFDLFPYGIY